MWQKLDLKLAEPLLFFIIVFHVDSLVEFNHKLKLKINFQSYELQEWWGLSACPVLMCDQPQQCTEDQVVGLKAFLQDEEQLLRLES